MRQLRSLGRGPLLGVAAVLVIGGLALGAMVIGGQRPDPTPTPAPSLTQQPTPSPTQRPTPTAEPTVAPPAARCPPRGPPEGLTGPTRSGRYYRVDLWQALHVLPFFFGASPGALNRFDNAGMPYVNGITGAWPWFRRFGDYGAPHNLYGDLEAVRTAFGANARLDALVARVGAIRPPFAFDPDVQLPAGRRVAAIEIRTNSYWRFGWSWDAALDAWRRSDGGKPVVDAISSEPVTATHVLVQWVTQEGGYGDPHPGGDPRRLQHLVGTGTGTLYSDGRAIAGLWSRPAAADGTHWTYEESGDPGVLPPGLIWGEIVPTGSGLTES